MRASSIRLDRCAPADIPALKPDVAWLLGACGLNFSFEKARGDFLYYRDANGELVEVLDLLGGFGASLFGHNHPDLVSAARQVLDDERPFNAQGSARRTAGTLAERLSERIRETTGARYVAVFASTGAEAVEAAIKHAALELAQRREAERRRIDEGIRDVKTRVRDGTLSIAPAFLSDAAQALGVSAPVRVEDLCDLLHVRADEALSAPPVFLALERGFHGKSSGAVQLTHNPEFRQPWSDVGLAGVTFLDPDARSDLDHTRHAARRLLYGLEIDAGGALELTVRSVSSIAGCFVEPIQGEGGICEIDADYLRALRTAATEDGFALIFDEIQCGMGRTGTFLASGPSGVAADYYLLSKSLGGGLAKISSLLIDSSRYVEGFGLLHTSTFADDDFSSAVALRALDILERDDGALMARCSAAGARLLSGLADLHRRFPAELVDVRGRGLMIGVELGANAGAASPFLRVAGEQNLLTYLVASYLARVHRIRVGPTLASHKTIRIEPSAFITEADIVRFLTAFDRVLAILRDGDAAALVAHLFDDDGRPEEPALPEGLVTTPLSLPSGGDRPKVGFLVHFTVPGDLAEWDPRLAVFTEVGHAAFLKRMRGLLAPFVFDRATLHSSTGAAVDLIIIAVPFTSQQALDSLRSGSRWATDLVKAALELAKHEGCRVLGLGGYTSIVTDSGRDLIDDEIAVTSGNSLTAAAAFEALCLSAARLQIDPSQSQLAVLGAAGNIGAALAELAAERVGRLLLVGRQGVARLLEPVVDAIYAAEFGRVRAGSALGGIAAAMAKTATVRTLLINGASDVPDLGQRIRCGLRDELGASAPIQLSHDIGSLRSCQLILSATNSPRPVLREEHLPEGPAVVCDIAVPQDVDPSVLGARHASAILRGGIVRAPSGQRLRFAGTRLQDGELYACLAEAALLGLVGCSRHYSRGPLTAAGIRHIRELAETHGFTIEERLATERPDTLAV